MNNIPKISNYEEYLEKLTIFVKNNNVYDSNDVLEILLKGYILSDGFEKEYFMYYVLFLNRLNNESVRDSLQKINYIPLDIVRFERYSDTLIQLNIKEKDILKDVVRKGNKQILANVIIITIFIFTLWRLEWDYFIWGAIVGMILIIYSWLKILNNRYNDYFGQQINYLINNINGDLVDIIQSVFTFKESNKVQL